MSSWSCFYKQNRRNSRHWHFERFLLIQTLNQVCICHLATRKLLKRPHRHTRLTDTVCTQRSCFTKPDELDVCRTWKWSGCEKSGTSPPLDGSSSITWDPLCANSFFLAAPRRDFDSLISQHSSCESAECLKWYIWQNINHFLDVIFTLRRLNLKTSCFFPPSELGFHKEGFLRHLFNLSSLCVTCGCHRAT